MKSDNRFETERSRGGARGRVAAINRRDGAKPLIIFEDRPSESPLIERVWRSRSDHSGMFHSVASCQWNMVVSRVQGKITLTVRGPETRVTSADCPADGEWFGIRFKLGTFMPLLPPGIMRDRNDVTLQNATSRSFWLKGSAWEFPTFDNAETFVNRLVRAGLIVEDSLVSDVLGDRPRAVTTRTEERRFRQITGLTRGAIHQIERARFATCLLQQGVPNLAATCEAGYYDQAHFNRSLKRWIGLTPGEIIRGTEQLSFLYNTKAEAFRTVPSC